MAQNIEYDTRMPGPMSEWPLTKYEQATNDATAALFADYDSTYPNKIRNAMDDLLQAGLGSEEQYPVEHVLAQVVLLGRLATGMARHHGDLSDDARMLFAGTDVYEQELARREKKRG